MLGWVALFAYDHRQEKRKRKEIFDWSREQLDRDWVSTKRLDDK